MGEEVYAKQKTPRGAVPAAVSCRRRGLCCAGVPVCSAAASANAADIHPDQVLRVLLYQDSKSVPLISLAEKAIGDRVALLGERIAPDTLVLTPKRISGREMLDTVCTMAQVGAEQVLALAGGQPMLELVQAVEHSAVAADAPAELRLAAGQVTLTDAAGGAAVEVLYRMVRAAEKSV